LVASAAHGFIADYQGVWIANGGTGFRISGAMVWMVVVGDPHSEEDRFVRAF
jgi:hypothetical protein